MERGIVSISSDASYGDSALYRFASALAIITIVYNILEGIISLYFGIRDETISLFGFGLDSFVEVISGLGIWHMLRRLRRNNYGNPDRFEKRALKITGTSFYILFVGLIATAGINLYHGHKPETAFWGIIVALVSILCMRILIHYKVDVGTRLNSQAILADAKCSKACMYISIVLLCSSLGYQLTGIGGMDSVGAALIAVICLREGRESFQKARNDTLLCSCKKCH